MHKELKKGGEYSGFSLIDISPCPDYRGTGYLFRHERTGFQVYHLKNDNKERFFSYTIYTPPEDNTGVFHILEHTVLTGSKKYPVRDPFMALSRNSCNTFLNAMTAPDRTDYPAASPVKKDFDNIFSVYTDAVFAPLLRKEDFMQEGIRLSSAGGLHFEGVVFSEMQGDISSHQSVVQNASTRPLFDEDSPYRHEFGGNPPEITDLTYEKFIETYNRYYVPANMTLFLFGDLDVEEKLEMLDEEYLSKREKGEKAPRAASPSPWTEPRRFYATSSADEDDDSSSIMVSWLLGPSDDPRLNTELSLVVDVLLGSPGCPLYRRIVESGIGRDISSESGMSDAYRNLTFSVGFSGSEKGREDEAEAFILSSLEEIVEEGLDPVLVESSLRRMEFRIQEISDGLPEGYRIYFTRIDKGWAYGKNPSDMLQTLSMVNEIRKSIQENPKYVEDWIRTNLLENKHRLLSVVSMDNGTEVRAKKEIEDKLQEHKGRWNKNEEEAFLLFEDGEDSPEALSTLPRLELSDIPSELSTIDRSVDEDIVKSEIESNGIVYADIAFDISDFTMEEMEYA
ncbi:MAG: insulinase family protein, partial [Candidatus Ornithospirochaeta sp.]